MRLSEIDIKHRIAQQISKKCCVNAAYASSEVKISDDGESYQIIDIKLSGCEGEKRNGSKFCQKCADEHHSKQ